MAVVALVVHVDDVNVCGQRVGCLFRPVRAEPRDCSSKCILKPVRIKYVTARALPHSC